MQTASANVSDQNVPTDLAVIDIVRQPYASPVLALLGDLRSMTLGGSVGPGDSRNGSIQEF